MLGYTKGNVLTTVGSDHYLEKLVNLCHYWEKYDNRSEAISMSEYLLGSIPGFSEPMEELESKVTRKELMNAFKRDPRWSQGNL